MSPQHKNNSTNFKASLQSITSAVTAMKGIKAGAYIGSNGLFDSATVNAYRASIKGLSATQAEAALSASGLNAAQRQQILTSKESTVANAGQATSFNVLTKAVWANVKAMAKWLVTTPTGWITLAIGATVGLITAYNNVEKKQNELIENARNLQEEYRSFAKDAAGKISSLEGQAEEFNKLAKGVDKYGNNISLASDEYDRYKSIVAEILGYSPELIQGYDAEGNAIADKNGLLERSIELLKEEQRLKLKEMTTDEKTGEAYDAAEAGWQQVQGYEGANTRNEIARWFDDNALRGGVNYEVDIAKVLGIKDEWKEEGNNLQNAIINNIDTVVKNIKDKKQELLAISDSDGNAIFSVDEIDNMIDLSNDWQYAYNQWQQDIEDAKHGMDDQFDLYAQRAKSYNDLTDAQKAFVNEYIRATGDITDAEGHLLSEDKILEKAKGYEKFVNEFAELNKLGEGGSVDLTFRPEIDTEELSKKGWEAGEGFATVFSSAISNTDFDDLIPKNAEDTVAINFTPIIVDPNTGEFKGVLSEEELYAYAHDVLSGVREDDLNLQIGAKFEGKNAIDEAVADGERIHYLHEKLFINNDTVDSWEELRKVLVKTGDDAVQVGGKVNKMTDSLKSLNESLDKIQSAYQAVESAIEEYNKEGYLSVDTFQSLIGLEPQYLNMLLDENGNLNLNTDAVNENTRAYLQNLGIKSAEAMLDTLTTYSSEAEQLDYLSGALNTNTQETWANVYAKLEQLKVDGKITDAVYNSAHARLDAYKKMTDDAIDGIGKGGLGKSASDTSDKIKDTKKQLDDLAKTEALDALKYKFDQLEQSIEKVDNAMSLLDTTLDLQAENDYVGKLETVTRQLDLAQQKSALLRDEFAQLSNTQYNTADEANELATRMKSVADSIADNSKNIIEYGKSITEYYMSAMSSIGSMADASIERATSLFERNVKTLQEGGLTGLQFNLSPIVPQSAFEKQRQENRNMEDEMRSYYDTVADMQKTALDLQYQETVADNERKRQELLGSLNEAMSTQQTYSSGLQSLQKSTNNATSQEQVQDDKEKLAEQTSFISSMEENIAGLNNWMVENPIKAPELDKTSWNKLATDIEEQVKNMGKTFSDFRLPNLSLGESEGGYNGSGGKGIVSVAASYAGTPYVYGGGHGDGGKNGLDCSGYVSAVLTDMGWTGGATTAEGFKSVGTKVSKSDMQPGDILVIDWDGGGVADHVGIYAGNGQMWHSSGNSSNTASNPGRGVSLGNVPDGSVVQVRRTPYSVYAKGTKDFAVYGDNINGVAGENYKPEILVDKKTGEMIPIDEPTFVDTNKYDVVGEKTTAKVLPQYATGTPTTDTKILSYIKRASEETGVPANIIMAVMDQETGYTWYDSVSDGTAYSHGYMMLYDNGAIADIKQKYGEEYANQAKTDKYTNVLEGARLLASKYQEYGDWQTAISRYNGKGKKANKYGETVYARAYSSDFIEAANNLGSIASYTSDTANNTSSTAKNILEFRKSFDSQLQEWINGGDSTSTSSTTEDELLAYIKENIKLGEYGNEEFIKKWDAFQEINEKGNIKFKALDEFLLKSVGTGNYNATKDSVVKEINDYTNAIMEASAEANLAELKSQYDINKDIANKMLAFYNYKKAEGATADVLTTIINFYNKQLEKVNDISDEWVSTMQSLTDYLMSQDATKLQAHDDRLSWIEKENEEFTRQYENTDENDFASKTALAERIVDRHNQIISENVKKQNTAHQNVLDLYNNEDYMPIFERYDVEAWFDASGEATAKYNEELAALSATNSELATVMTQVFAIIQQNKKAFYEANEAIQFTNESLIDFNKNRKLENVDVYIKYQERLVEALDFDASISQSLSTAKEGMYNIFKTLRDEKAEMDKELKANMQIDDWLTEDTRKLLFNLDDYEEQMETINGIQAEAEKLYINYKNELEGLKEDELYKEEEITAEYNRQLEKLQDKLSVAKADLQLAKDKAAFENTRKERDTQIIMGNGVRNVADPERLREAAMKMAESESALGNEVTTSAENQDIRNMEIATGMINQEKAAIQNRIDMINDMTSAEREALAGYIEPIEIIGAKLNAISKTNPERIINGDNSNKVLSGLDLTKRDGWSLTGDHSEMVEMFSNLLENGYYKKNTFEYDVVSNLVEWIKWQHDNETTSDAYNYGYSLYNADNAYLWGKGAMKIYSDDAFRVMSQPAVPIDEYINDIINSRIDEEKLNVVVSGGINVVTNNPQSTYPSFLQGYEELDGVSMFQQTLGVDEDAASAIFERFEVGNIAPTIDTFVTLAEMAKVWGNASDTRGNTDNSVHMENVNITLEKPVTNPNDFVQQFINKVYSEYSTTNNQR